MWELKPDGVCTFVNMCNYMICYILYICYIYICIQLFIYLFICALPHLLSLACGVLGGLALLPFSSLSHDDPVLLFSRVLARPAKSIMHISCMQLNICPRILSDLKWPVLTRLSGSAWQARMAPSIFFLGERFLLGLVLFHGFRRGTLCMVICFQAAGATSARCACPPLSTTLRQSCSPSSP